MNQVLQKPRSGEICVTIRNVFNEGIQYRRHKFEKDSQSKEYKYICKKCRYITFIRPDKQYFSVARPTEEDADATETIEITKINKLGE